MSTILTEMAKEHATAMFVQVLAKASSSATFEYSHIRRSFLSLRAMCVDEICIAGFLSPATVTVVCVCHLPMRKQQQQQQQQQKHRQRVIATIAMSPVFIYLA
jgi:hypothetical protein